MLDGNFGILAQKLLVERRLRPGGFISSPRGVFILECVSLPQPRENLSEVKPLSRNSSLAAAPLPPVTPRDIPGNVIPGKLLQFGIIVCSFIPSSHSLLQSLCQDPKVLCCPSPTQLHCSQLGLWCGPACCWGILGCFLLGMGQEL